MPTCRCPDACRSPTGPGRSVATKRSSASAFLNAQHSLQHGADHRWRTRRREAESGAVDEIHENPTPTVRSTTTTAPYLNQYKPGSRHDASERRSWATALRQTNGRDRADTERLRCADTQKQPCKDEYRQASSSTTWRTSTSVIICRPPRGSHRNARCAALRATGRCHRVWAAGSRGSEKPAAVYRAAAGNRPRRCDRHRLPELIHAARCKGLRVAYDHA